MAGCFLLLTPGVFLEVFSPLSAREVGAAADGSAGLCNEFAQVPARGWPTWRRRLGLSLFFVFR